MSTLFDTLSFYQRKKTASITLLIARGRNICFYTCYILDNTESEIKNGKHMIEISNGN